jgi:hypothetical protein
MNQSPRQASNGSATSSAARILAARTSSSRRYADLTGGSGRGVRFRPARLSAAELPDGLACRLRCADADVGPLALLDLGPGGLAVQAPSGGDLHPGSRLEEVERMMRDRVLWSGTATVVHRDASRLGVRFDLPAIDVRRLQLEARLERRMA